MSLPAGTEDLVAFTNVHVVLRRVDGSVALDTTFAFPSEASALTVSLNVKLSASAPATGEPMLLDLSYINAAGQIVFRSASVSVIAVPALPGATSEPVTVPVTYVGPGSTATAVRITPKTLSVNTGAPFAFTAVAVDANGNAVPNTPIVWTTADPTRVTLPSSLSGSGTALSVRGTARIIAQLITSQTDTAILTVSAVPSAIALGSGSGQSAKVGKATPTVLPQPIIAKVTGADGQPVAGVSVSFAVATGGGSVSPATATTDANGNAQASWTLGNTVGTQTATASATGLSGSPVTFTATGTAGTATKLGILNGPAVNANVNSGASLGIDVRALDVDGDLVSSFTGPITIALSTNPSAGTLAGTTTVNAVNGVASFGSASIAKPGAGYVVTASSGTLASVSTPAFNVVTGPASSIVIVSGGTQTGAAGAALAAPIVVLITDAQGNAKPNTAVAFTVASGGGSVAPTSGSTDANGKVVTNWTLGSTVGTQTITVSSTGLTSVTVSATATGSSNHWVITQQPPTSAVAGAALSPAISAVLQDGSNNTVTSFNGTATISLSTNPSSATLGGTTSVTASSGVATFPGLRVNLVGTGYVLSVNSTGATTGATNAFNITTGAASILTLQSGSGQTAAFGTQLAQPVIAKVTDAQGNPVSGTAVVFAVTAGGGSVGTPNATSNSSGLASSTWTLGASGTQTISISSAGLTGSPISVAANSAAGPLTRTQLLPNPDTLTALNASQALTARGFDANNTQVAGSWTYASRNTAIATVNASGLVTAVANGSTYVVATETGGTIDSSFTVVQQRIATVNVNPSTRSLYTGGNFTYTAQAVDGNGFAVASQPTFTWTSTAPAVATVNGTTGVVSALTIGSTQIRATAGTITGVGNLTVLSSIRTIDVTFDSTNAPAPDVFTITALGNGRKYRAIARDTLGAVVNGVTLTWASSNPSVAAVDTAQPARAHVIAVANGITSIQASVQGTVGSASLTVAQALSSIELLPTSVTVGITGTTQLIARGKDANGYFISGGSFTYSSATPTVVSVNATSGVATGQASGTANITATSGAITSNVAVVSVNNSGPSLISFGRDTIGVGRSGSVSVPVLLSKPSASAVVVGLAVRDTNANFSTASVTIPAGQTSVNATLNGHNAGSTVIMATDISSTGYTAATAVVNVSAVVKLTNTSYALVTTDQVATQVLLSDPAPAGGTYVTFSYGTANVASVSPDPAFIPAGQLASNIVITGTSSTTRSTTVTPASTGVTGTASTVTSYAAALTSTSRFILGAGQTDNNNNVYVQVPTTLRNALNITLTSSDTNVVTAPPSITIPSGASYLYYGVVAKAPGTATVTASATGYTPTNVQVIATTPKVRLTGGGTYNTTSSNLTMSAYTTDSLNTQHPRSSSLTVRIASADPTIIQVLDTVVTIAAGASSVSGIRVVPGGAGGSVYVRVTASGHSPDSVRYTINAPALTANSTTFLGAGQYTSNVTYVQIPSALSTPLTVSLTSSDPSKLTVPATVSIPAGSSYTYYTATGVAPGTVTITATATGYTTVTSSLTVTTPRLQAGGGTTISSFGTASVFAYARDSAYNNYNPVVAATVVHFASTDTNVIKVDSTVTIPAGQYYSGSNPVVTAVGSGSAYVVTTSPGFIKDSTRYTVQAAKLNISFTTTVIAARQESGANNYYVSLPNNRTTTIPVTLTHSQPVVSSTSTNTVTIPANNSYNYFGIKGLSIGADTVIATASGYLPDTGIVIVRRPKFQANNQPSSANTTSPPATLTLYVSDSSRASGNQYASDTVTVHAVSSNPSVIQPASAYFKFNKGDYYANTVVNYVGVGSAFIVYSDSANSGYLPDTTNTVTVTGPSLSMSTSALVLGMRQLEQVYVSVPNAPSSNLVVNLLSTSTRVAKVPATVTIPAGQTYAYFNVYAQDTIGTIQVQASATGYNATSQNVQVTQPRFSISTYSTAYTNGGALYFQVTAQDANGTQHAVNERVTVTLASSAVGVASIDSVTVNIDSGSYYNQGATWTPHAVGAAQFSASDSRAAFYKYNTATFNVTVTTPPASLSFSTLTLGIGQYVDEYGYVPNTTPGFTAALGHAATPRTTTTPSSLVFGTSDTYKYFQLLGTSAGNDTINFAPPGHIAAQGVVVVAKGRIDPISGFPSTLNAGDSVLVTIYAYDQNQSSRYVAANETFTISTSGKAVFRVGNATVTSITIPANAYYVQAYIKGVSAGTETVTLTNSHYTTYTGTISVNP